MGTRSGASDLARLASAIKGQQLRGAAVDNYARWLATAFVLACCVVGAVLGALYSLVAAVIGGWRG